MTGGLTQIILYGSQDIFLTGNPQITFFKLVYRRHTNFAIETIEQEFIGDINFNNEVTANVNKIGDLMGQTYLIIEIPQINLVKKSKIDFKKIKEEYDIYRTFYDYLNIYLTSDINIIKELKLLITTDNINADIIYHFISSQDKLETEKRNLINYLLFNETFQKINNLQDHNIVLEINLVDVRTVVNNIYFNNRLNIHFLKNEILSHLDNILETINKLYLTVYKEYFEKYQHYQSTINNTHYERHCFAWIEELGHNIIDFIDIRIGNKIIDTHTGDWLTVFNSIMISPDKIDGYNQMIGNINDLTTFNNQIKKKYTLYIPLQFWFCRHTGTSLPLIALKYHDVVFTLKFKDLSMLCHTDNDIEISTLQNKFGVNITNAKLFINHIFLDSNERRKFAQSTHEYLIETVQYNEYDNIIGKYFKAHLSFINPVKFLVWFVQPNFRRQNQHKSQRNEFGIFGKKGYPINHQYLLLNGYEITDKTHHSMYFNYVQPYLSFNCSPSDGLNIYSFAMYPKEYQPSSTCNMSRINDASIIITFDDSYLEMIHNSNPENLSIYLGIYAYSYNILRIMSGMGGLAFN